MSTSFLNFPTTYLSASIRGIFKKKINFDSVIYSAVFPQIILEYILHMRI